MSSVTGNRYHIPFPRAFLSLNTPVNKATNAGTITSPVTSPEATAMLPHGFLSNRPAVVPRHASISSVSSDSSVGSDKVSESPIFKPAVAAFLTLNSKHVAPPASAKELSAAEKSSFLSNRG